LGLKDFEIQFMGGNSVTIVYPRKLEKLTDVIESELLLETSLYRRQVDNLKCYLNDYIEEIESALKELP
jgi:hypothetical protein